MKKKDRFVLQKQEEANFLTTSPHIFLLDLIQNSLFNNVCFVWYFLYVLSCWWILLTAVFICYLFICIVLPFIFPAQELQM